MKEFFQLNKTKLVFAFKFTSVVFLVLVLIFFGICYLNGQVPELTLLLIVIFGAGIGMPIFVLLVGTLRGTWDLKKRRKAFSQSPFSELLEHGFKEKLKHNKNKWGFTEPILTGWIEDFEILAEVDTQDAPDIIRFQALTEVEALGNDEVKRLNRKFSSEDIELDIDGVTKNISIKNHRINTIDQLNKELNRFIRTIKLENFRPKKDHEQNISYW